MAIQYGLQTQTLDVTTILLMFDIANKAIDIITRNILSITI